MLGYRHRRRDGMGGCGCGGVAQSWGGQKGSRSRAGTYWTALRDGVVSRIPAEVTVRCVRVCCLAARLEPRPKVGIAGSVRGVEAPAGRSRSYQLLPQLGPGQAELDSGTAGRPNNPAQTGEVRCRALVAATRVFSSGSNSNVELGFQNEDLEGSKPPREADSRLACPRR